MFYSCRETSASAGLSKCWYLLPSRCFSGEGHTVFLKWLQWSNQTGSCTLQFANTLIANEVTVRGTKYRKNMIIMIKHDDEGLVTGKIKLVLVHKDSAVYFLAEKYHALRIPDMAVYSPTLMPRSYCCINQENVLDYYPLPEYTVHGIPLIIFHHSFPLVQNDGWRNQRDHLQNLAKSVWRDPVANNIEASELRLGIKRRLKICTAGRHSWSVIKCRI